MDACLIVSNKRTRRLAARSMDSLASTIVEANRNAMHSTAQTANNAANFGLAISKDEKINGAGSEYSSPPIPI
jgi:hypothetical protein